MRLLLAVCFVVVLGGNARAEQFVETRGFGDVPCATYAEVYRKYQDEGEVNNKYFSWALGFISGINVMQESFFFDPGCKDGERNEAVSQAVLRCSSVGEL
jgi:hypothetical protein